MKLGYRADLDGIRAIAVLAVLFYHADIKTFSGGYVGVDIFFVISGYLITTIILKEIDGSDFSIAKFYERRIRRIFPALFTVLVATILASWWLYSANAFKDFSQSLIATTLFGSNILFWTQSGYFEGPSVLKPLLHTWSLAVEEQFYIFFPLLLMVLARYARPKLKFILLGIALASFALDIYTLNSDTSSAFYLAHLRIWELLIGSLLATELVTTKINSFIANAIGLIGLALVAVPIFFYTNDTTFPGLAAALPTIGAAFLIYSGTENKTLVAKILSLGPVVFIGQISYSLYLWHWPIIVFARYYAIIQLTPWEMAAVLVAIFIVSILSWKFIEKPFREKALLKQRRSVFMFGAIVMGVALALGSVTYLNNGFPSRFSKQANLNPNANPQVAKWKSCDATVQRLSSPSNLCTVGSTTNAKTPSFLLWGDSHARAVAPAIQISAARVGSTGLVAYTNGCPPLLGIDRQGQPPTCSDLTTATINYIGEHPNLHTIILASRWAISANGTRFKTEDGPSVILVNMIPGSSSANTNATLFELGLDRTVSRLLQMGRKVVIVTQIPEVGYNVPSALYMAARSGRDLNTIIAPSLSDYINRNKIDATVIKLFAQNANVQIVEPWKKLCNQKYCAVVSQGQSLYLDDDHLSILGARYISSIFDPVFNDLQGQ